MYPSPFKMLFIRVTLPGPRRMKPMLSLLLICCLQLHAVAYSQTITMSVKNMSLDKIFNEVQRQSGYNFLYSDQDIKNSRNVDVSVKDATIEEVLKICFYNQPLTYNIVEKVVVVKAKSNVPVAGQAERTVAPPPIDVRGKIVNEDGEPVVATVEVKGTGVVTTSGTDGQFTLSGVSDEATLIITGVSIEVHEVKLNGRNQITINVRKSVKSLDESVVVAYSTTTQRANTAALTVVKGEQIQTIPHRSMDKSLQGLVPGLLVTSGTGQPGGGTSNFVLRGIATADNPASLNASRNPLIVVDGIPVSQDHNQWTYAAGATATINPLAQLNPSDIETITVLKDAAAIALYGSKSSNGVILITTKKGKAGKTVFSFRHQTDFSKRLKGKVELVNRAEYLELLYESYRNIDPSFWTDLRIDSALKKNFPTRSDGSFYPEVDWENEMFTDQAATISNELSMSGGNERSNFYINLEYTKQNGAFKGTGYDRKSVRMNFENRPVKWFKLGLRTGLSYNVQDYTPLTAIFPMGVTLNSPLNPNRLENGEYLMNFNYPLNAANPVVALELNKFQNASFRGLSSLYGEIDFLKYFKFSSTLGVDFMLTESKEVADKRLYDGGSIGSGRILENNVRNANIITNNILRFNKTIQNTHNINILAGQEAQMLNTKITSATGTNLRVPGNDYIGNAGTVVAEVDYVKQNLLSYFGQANYGYKNKYFFTSTIRADGSSLFGGRNRFGTYWSTGLGWVLTEERFMKKTSPFLNYLKLRGSIGAAGNSFGISSTARYDLLLPMTYVNNFAMASYQPGNPDIKWEETFTWDVGIEGRLWKERIIFSADVYKRKTFNLIYGVTLPLSTGWNSVPDNIGDIVNKGVEVSLSVDVIKNNAFRWNVNMNWSTNRNVLVRADNPLGTVTATQLANIVGENFNSFYLYRWAGVNAADGAPMWIDSTGKANTNRNAAKRELVGKPQPDGFGSVTHSLTYKNFQLSALFYYQYGYQIYMANTLTNDGNSPYYMQDKKALDRWKKPGDVALNPKRVLNNSLATTQSTRFLFDGDHIRIQTVTLSYFVPRKIIDRVGLSLLRLYVQAYNLAIWTKYPGYDVGSTNPIGANTFTAYPNQRSFTVGANINF